MFEKLFRSLQTPLSAIAGLDIDVVLLTILIVSGAIVLRFFFAQAKKTAASVGMVAESTAISIDGSRTLPVRHYVSDMQGLAGRPDALISENGFIIPVERKPLARKLRDRYVAQVLVYMRLVEEFEGKKPPYGYLILGSKCRKVKIENSEKRQAWLQSHLDQMRAILDGADAVPAPEQHKCQRCDVQAHCQAANLVKLPQRKAENE